MRPLLEGWKLVRLADVADTALGKMLDRGRPKGLPQVPYLRNVNVQWGHIDTSDIYTMELGEDERDRFAVQRGDLLVCEGGEIGRAAIWRGGSEYLAYQKAVHRIRSSSALHLPYLRYLFELYSVDGTLGRFSTGSTIAHLPQQKLRELPVPLPPLQEQSRIVEILEDHLSRLDATEGLMLKAERRLAALRRSTLKAVINRADRETVPLRRLVKRIEAGRSFGGAAAPAVKGQWGIVKVSAMTWGEFRPDENKAVPADAADPRYEIRPGDLLLSRANTNDYVGASVLVERVRPRLLLATRASDWSPARASARVGFGSRCRRPLSAHRYQLGQPVRKIQCETFHRRLCSRSKCRSSRRMSSSRIARGWPSIPRPSRRSQHLFMRRNGSRKPCGGRCLARRSRGD